MSITYSEIESKRFGLRIYRGQYEDFDIKDVQKIVDENDFDIIMVRYPTSTIFEFEACKIVYL